jgi:TP901-1 family phage major tail protein
MAQTAGVVSGTNLRLFVDSAAVAYATTCTANFTAEIITTVHKDSPGGGWPSGTVGNRSGSVTSEGLVNEDGAANTPFSLLSKLAAGTAVTWAFTTGEEGDTQLVGDGFISSLSLNAAVNENATFSVELTVIGEPLVQEIT